VTGLAGRRIAALAVSAATVAVVWAPASSGRPAQLRPTSYPVGLRVIRFVDTSRSIVFKHRREPRTLLTQVRYPAALGPPSATDVPNAPAASADGPFPLIVFGHGFKEGPTRYARLLQAWAHAGYVVAAPLFPGENPAAPGGPNENDIVNEPADMSFVISRMLALGAGSGPLSGLIDPSLIAAAGQSDGAEVALAVAVDPRYRDPRVRAAIILSGAEGPTGKFTFAPDSPPVLAAQGTADPINLPRVTYHWFRKARRPKYLLRLLGATHLPPYTEPGPDLEIVERTTLAFLGAYLKDNSLALARLQADGDVPGVASLQADP